MNKKIIFVDHYSDSALPLYERMKEENFSVHLIKPKRRIGFTKYLRPYWYEKVIPNADLYIVTVRSRKLAPQEKAVFFVHSIGLEEAVKSDERYRAIFVTGPKWMDEYKRIFSNQYYGKLKGVGFPPLEQLISEEARVKAREIKEKLQLGNKPTLLFGILAETREIESLLISEALAELEKIADELQLNLIVKPNRYFKVWGESLPHNKYIDFKKKIKNKPHIHLISCDESILPYYYLSDILISGRCSSIITEFMSLNKPVIQLIAGNPYPVTLDKPSNLESMGDSLMPYFDIGLYCGIRDLQDCVKRSLKDEDEFSKERIKWVNKSVYSPQGTLDRAIEEIKKLL